MKEEPEPGRIMTRMPSYQVLVDDNYHYMDESERYSAGTFKTLEEALKQCREIVQRSLRELYREGSQAKDLLVAWQMFGEDPWISTDDPALKGVAFSARSYLSEAVCQAVLDELSS